MTEAPDKDEYLIVEHAAEFLRVSTRMVNEYGRSDPPKIRTKKVGKRVLYHAGDVAQLANDLNVASKPPPQKQMDMSVYEPGPYLDYIREKDAEIQRLNNLLYQTNQDVGRARVLLEQMHQIQEERDKYQKQLEDLQRSPWRKFLARFGIK